MALALFLLSTLASSYGAPTDSAIPSLVDSIRSTVFGRQASESVDPAGARTTQDIIWSCLATIFACTWVAIHPNIPGPDESTFVKLKRKTVIMIYALIAPEMMMSWAAMQWLAAGRIAEAFNKANGLGGQYQVIDSRMYNLLLDRWSENQEKSGSLGYRSKRWTRTHGFFVQMGGFMLVEGDIPKRALTFKELQMMIEHRLVDIPTIREDEIQDRSKGDSFTKLIVVVQTTWFVFQCIARWANHLPVTELEVITLAFAALNVIIYGFWWGKPQNVLVAFDVPLKTSYDSVAELVASCNADIQWTGSFAGVKRAVDRVQRLERNRKVGGVLHFIVVRIFWPLAIPFFPLTKMTGIDRHVQAIKGVPRAPRSPLRLSVYYADRESGEGGVTGLSFTGFIGPLFGAIHLISWASAFPSTTERWLWRSSALAITIAPIVGLASLRVFAGTNLFFRILKYPLGGLAALGAPLYIISRLVLLVLGFTTLRRLPPGTHANISWTTFVPHFG